MTRRLSLGFALFLLVPTAATAQAPAPPSGAPSAATLGVETPPSPYAVGPIRPLVLAGSRAWTVTHGGVPLSETTFYSLVGREDLVERARSRQQRGDILLGAGVVAGIARVLAVSRGVARDESCQRPLGGCAGMASPAAVGIGSGLLVGAVTAVSVAVPLRRRAVAARVASAEIARYNAGL